MHAPLCNDTSSVGVDEAIPALLCRAGRQIRRRGLTAYQLEFWIEGMVKLIKSSVRGRAVANAEAMIVAYLLLRLGLARARLLTTLPLLSHAQLDEQKELAEAAAKSSNGAAKDPGVVGRYEQLLGAKQGTTVLERQADMSVLRKLAQLDGGMAAALPASCLEDCDVLRYGRAQLSTRELVYSTSWRKQGQRTSHWVTVTYEDDGTYVAEVKHFLLVRARGQDGDSDSACGGIGDADAGGGTGVACSSSSSAAADSPGASPASSDSVSAADRASVRVSINAADGSNSDNDAGSASMSTSSDPASKPAERFAVCNLYKVELLSTFAGDILVAKCGVGSQPQLLVGNRDYPVSLSNIGRKVVFLNGADEKARMVPDLRGWLFESYPSNMPHTAVPSG